MQSVVYSVFDYKVGPDAKASFPPRLGQAYLDAISMRSLNLLSSQQELLPKNIEIVSFPSLQQKGLILFFRPPAKAISGPGINATLVLAFKEEEDIVFYKYIEHFTPLFADAAKQIIDREQQGAGTESVEAVLEEFMASCVELLDELLGQELSVPQDKGEAFPKPQARAGKVFTFKLIVCGEPAVGKTSLVLRFTKNAFRKTYLATMGVNLTEKELALDDGSCVDFVLWDVAGQDKFSVMRRHFYTGARAILLVFDLTDRASFEKVQHWHDDMRDNMKKKDTPGVLIANKMDLDGEIVVHDEEIDAISSSLGFPWFKTSALTGERVDEIFKTVAATLLRK